MIGNSNERSNFFFKLLRTDRQVASFCIAFVNDLSVNIKLSKTKIYEIVQSGFLSRFFSPLLKFGLAIMENVLIPIAKSVLIPLGLKGVLLSTLGASLLGNL